MKTMKKLLALVLFTAILLPFVLPFTTIAEVAIPEPEAAVVERFFKQLKDFRVIITSTDYTYEQYDNGLHVFEFEPTEGLMLRILYEEDWTFDKLSVLVDTLKGYAITKSGQIEGSLIMAYCGFDEQTAYDIVLYLTTLIEKDPYKFHNLEQDGYNFQLWLNPLVGISYNLSISPTK